MVGTILFTKEGLELWRHSYLHSLPFPDRFNVMHHKVKIRTLITQQKLMEQNHINTQECEV
jgi:hypothetical protein